MPVKLIAIISILFSLVFVSSFKSKDKWQSKFVKQNKDGSLEYFPDEKGNIIPDFSRVGYYHGDKEIGEVPVVETIYPSDNSWNEIKNSIDELSKKPLDKNGFRG